MQDQLLAQIAKLPNTTVAPYRDGGGVHIIEQRANGVRTQGIWLDRPRTVQYLQDYLQSRQEPRTIELEGDTWRVIGVGVTREDGLTYCHLASTTRFVEQRNGARPIQIGEWVGL